MMFASSNDIAVANTIFMAFGALLLGIGINLFNRRRTFLVRTRIITGRVSAVHRDHERVAADTSRHAYRVTVEFTLNGYRRKVNCVVWSNVGVVHATGDTVKLHIDPDYPEQAELYNPAALLSPILCMLVGLAIIAAQLTADMLR
jgi:hypothetical protein